MFMVTETLIISSLHSLKQLNYFIKFMLLTDCFSKENSAIQDA
jgi:hypothetical protein